MKTKEKQKRIKKKWTPISWDDKKSVKKLISRLFLILVIIGYSFIAIFNVLVILSIKDIGIHPKEFQQTTPDNETIIMEGEIIIENDHWNSIDIVDLNLNISIETDQERIIFSYNIHKDVIPRLQNTTIEIEFEFSIYTLDLELFEELNSTEYIVLDLSLSFYYAFYYVELQFDTKLNF